MDDEAVKFCYSLVIYSAVQSQQRVDLARLAVLERICAIIPATMAKAKDIKVLKRRARS